jgi:hypothetical protein
MTKGFKPSTFAMLNKPSYNLDINRLSTIEVDFEDSGFQIPLLSDSDQNNPTCDIAVASGLLEYANAENVLPTIHTNLNDDGLAIISFKVHDESVEPKEDRTNRG